MAEEILNQEEVKPAKAKRASSKKVDNKSEEEKPVKKAASKRTKKASEDASEVKEVKKTTRKTTKKVSEEKVEAEAKVEKTEEVKPAKVKKSTKKAETSEEVKPAKVKKSTKKAETSEVVKPEVVESKSEVTFKYRPATNKDYDLLLNNIVTEKTQNLSINNNTITLKVSNKATANEVKAAVQAVFGVKVDKVNIVKVLPRAKRVTRYPGHVPGYKKAYVKINKDFNLGEIAKATSTESN